MAYQETEKTRARKEAQARLIIASAIDIIKRDGLDGLTTRTLAERAGVAKGLIFHYYPDMAELLAKVEHTIIMRDTNQMRRAAEPHANMPLLALVDALRVLFTNMHSRESREMAGRPGYSHAVAVEIERLLRPIDADGDRKLIARATLGVVSQLAVAAGSGPKRQQAAILFVLKAIGATVTDQRKALELM